MHFLFEPIIAAIQSLELPILNLVIEDKFNLLFAAGIVRRGGRTDETVPIRAYADNGNENDKADKDVP